MKQNSLANETSPYLLQHAQNPVNWYPWSEAAFSKAKQEDKAIFLSIGYSTCHWCHVMAHESFENEQIASALNENFVAIKVDREERPDIDNVYMRTCQAATGSGGWPMSIFMTPEKKPFFAGTYFPPQAFLQIVNSLTVKWQQQRQSLTLLSEQLQTAVEELFGERTASGFTESRAADTYQNVDTAGTADTSQNSDTAGTPDTSQNSDTAGTPDFYRKQEAQLRASALQAFIDSFDNLYGGFGKAPKFPTPHNLIFLLGSTPEAVAMAEKTLLQMYKGGIFDHIGGGFSRYSTDERWLAPHFEKMLYDNALLAITYAFAHKTTGKELYKSISEKTLQYMKNEMLSPEGGFYSAQDADTDGEEGKYYLLTRSELIELLGQIDGTAFCERYDISKNGNFEGKNIPNLIACDDDTEQLSQMPVSELNTLIPTVYRYRKARFELHTDIKNLTSWNALTAAAFAFAGRIFDRKDYLEDAKKTLAFLERTLQRNGILLSGFTSGKAAGPGFLDDYAFYIFALLQMYKATGRSEHLIKAVLFTKKTIDDFFDNENGGFFFSGKNNEKLITEVKESYDGAVPSGNSVMYYNLSRLIDIDIKNTTEMDNIALGDDLTTHLHAFRSVLSKQRAFMNSQSHSYPAGHCFYLLSLFPAKEIVCENEVCHPLGDIL